MTPEERIEQLEQEKSVLQEQLAQRNALIAQLLQRVQLLEERQAKDSHNSHLPPYSDRFVRQPKSLRQKSGKKPGGQAGHQGQSLRFSAMPNEVIVQRVERCQQCQAELDGVAARIGECRQVVDLPAPRVIVREYQSEQKPCRSCQQISVAPFPPVQYVTTVGAIGVYLVQQHLVPLARTCEILQDLLGIAMSERTLCSLIERCAQNLARVETHIEEALVQAEVIHQGETGLYVLGQRHWMHVTSTPRLTHYQVHSSRGKPALEAIGILPRFSGTSVHDGWSSYFLYPCAHATCNVHVLRDLTYLAEEQGLWWAAKLKGLLLEMKAATDELRERGRLWLDPLEVADWQARFLALLAEAEVVHPRAQAPPGHRGRVKQSSARNLLDRLRTHQQAVWAFLEDLRVPFDNDLTAYCTPSA